MAFGTPYALAAFLKLVQDALAFLQPQLLRWLLSYISDYQAARFSPPLDGSHRPDAIEGFAISFIMFIAAAIRTVILHQVCNFSDDLPTRLTFLIVLSIML